MLSFFRKHEKGFFLLLFIPTIVGLGVTSVITTVLTREASRFHPTFYGQEYTAAEWEKTVVPFKRVNRDATNDDEHRYMARLIDAESTGIHVSDERVAEGIVDDRAIDMARLRAQERIAHEHVDAMSEQGNRLFRTYFIEEIGNSRKNFTYDDYKASLVKDNISVQEYEAYQKRNHAVKELEALVKECVTVSPKEVWEAFREKRHTREAEVVALDATAYVPSPAATGSHPAAVTDAEVDSYYKKHKADYDEPRRVDVEFAACSFADVKRLKLFPEPDEAHVEKYWKTHPDDFSKNIAPVGSAEVMQISSFTDPGVREKAHDLLVDQLAGEKAQAIMEEVAARLDQQRAFGQKVSIADASSNTPAVVSGKTGLRTSEEIKTGKSPHDTLDSDKARNALLKGFSAYRWVESEAPSSTRTSDPLKGEEAVAILRTAEVKEKRTPTYDELKVQVRRDYLAGNELEIKRFYETYSLNYRLRDRYELEVVKAVFEDFSKHPDLEQREPTAAELTFTFDQQKVALWPRKKREEVPDAEIAHAWHAERGKPFAARTIQAVLDAMKAQYQATRQVDIFQARQKPTSEKTSFLAPTEKVTMDSDELANSPYREAGLAISQAAIGEPSYTLPFSLSDHGGMFVFIVRKKTEQRLPELDETIDGTPVRERVRKDLLLDRAFERATARADKLVLELRDLRGDALAKALEAKGLKAERTGFFRTGDRELPKPCAGSVANQVIAAAYTCEVGGGFERTVTDKNERKPELSRIFLVRCAAREEPRNEELKDARPLIRSGLLEKKRDAFMQTWQTERILKAKGIAKEHVRWVREQRDGPNGQVSSKVRQIFVPNDPKTLDDWLDSAASKRIEEALAELRRTNKWDEVVSKYSEDEGTQLTGGKVDGVARGEVARVLGPDFEARVFELPKGVVTRLKSRLGVHLVEVTELPQTPFQDPRSRRPPVTRMSFRHILVKTDAKLRNLPPEVEAKAREISRKKITDALKRLDEGEPFAKVADEMSDEENDEHERGKPGEPFSLDTISPLVLMALRQPLEPTDPEALVPEEIASGATKEWHLMVCARDPQDKEPAFKALPRSPRLVYELVGTRADVDHAKNALLEWKKQCKAKGVELDFHHLLKEWKKLCELHSKAPSRKKEGALGFVAVDPTVREWPEELLASLFTLPAGKRTGISETKDGFRIVEIVSVETKPADDPARDRGIAEAVLRGTEWVDGEAAERGGGSVPTPDFGWGD